MPPTIVVNGHPDTRGVTVVVRLQGEVTEVEADRVRAVLGGVVDQNPRRVVLDLSELTFITSQGLGVLLEFRRQLSATGATLRLAAVREDIAGMLRKTRLAEIFPMYPTQELAMRED